jgi:hypothetical protein
MAVVRSNLDEERQVEEAAGANISTQVAMASIVPRLGELKGGVVFAVLQGFRVVTNSVILQILDSNTNS